MAENIVAPDIPLASEVDLTYPPSKEWTDFPNDILLNKFTAEQLYKTAFAINGIAHLLSIDLVERQAPLIDGSGCEGLKDNTQQALATALDLLSSSLNESLTELQNMSRKQQQH